MERKISEQIARKTGKSLIYVNFIAMGLVQAGLCASRLEALKYLLEEL